MRNILMITNLYPGFAEESREHVTYAIHDFCKEWKREGYNVKVISIWNYYPRVFDMFSFAKYKKQIKNSDNFILDNLVINRIPAQKIPFLNYTNPKKLEKEILNNMNGFKPDVVIGHEYFSAKVALNVAKKLNIDCFYGVHHSDVRLYKYFKIFMNKDLGKFKGLGFRAKNLMENTTKSIPNAKFKSFIINSGVNTNTITFKANIINNKVKDKLKIIYVGRLLPLKKIDIIIKALKNVKYDYEFKIVGSGPQENKLKTLVRKLDMVDKVIFEGQLSKEKAIKEMEKSDVFVMVSAPETFGLVYLEAMAAGCVVIGSLGQGIDGVIVNNRNGFLCKPGSVEDLTKVLNDLPSKDLFRILNTAKKTIKEYTIENKSKEYINKVEELLNAYK